MPSVYDFYEFYLEPGDLKDKAHLVQVASARPETMFIPRINKKETKITLRFVNRRKGMILNKTQAGAMMNITGTDDYIKWAGHEVVLVADRASNGKDTIRVCTRSDSGDIDLMYPAAWDEQYRKIVKGIGLSQGEADKVLKECEGDCRTATERLTAQYSVKKALT